MLYKKYYDADKLEEIFDDTTRHPTGLRDIIL